MRIVVDLQGCQSASHARGIGRYSSALTTSLIEQAADDEVWLVLSDRFPERADVVARRFAALPGRHRVIRCSLPGPTAESAPANAWRARAAEWVRESFLLSLAPDVLLVSSLFEGWIDDAVASIGILGEGPPTAVIHYDLIPWLNQDAYLADARQRGYYERKLASLRHADLLLAISAYSRDEAKSHLALDASRVTNIAAAADSHFRPPPINDAERRAVPQRYHIARPFVLCSPGGFDSRKNLPRLIEAFAMLPADLRGRHQLAITSAAPEPVRNRLIEHGRRFGLAPDALAFTGFVPDDDLAKLYALCELFVFPSLHEGFGLPPLEAMSCGAPTIGSSATSLIEVLGWDEAMFDPSSSAAIAAAMRRGLEDDAYRQALRQNAARQAQAFSWQESARRALQGCRALARDRSEGRERQPLGPQATYRKLIDGLSALRAHAATAPTHGDLVQLAQAIARNEEVAQRTLRDAAHAGSA